ncbi:MAG: ABC transporter substrate-binding protein, partial [Culicoidibacterales bacterium]
MNVNFKKMMTSVVAGGLALSLAACGTSGTETGSSDAGSGAPLQVWTLSEDLKTFADHYMEENPDKKVEVTIISPADYPTKISTALRGKSSTPDIIVGEPQMLQGFMDAGYFEDLSQAPYNAEEYRDQLVDYVFEAGSDDDGIVRALSYQVTPGGVIYRRDIAKEVYGDDSPEFMATKFADMDAMLQTANEMKDAGYKVFSDTGNLRWFTNVGEDPKPWVVDNKLQMTEGKMQYFDTAVKLYQEDLTAFAGEWSAAWYASMAGEIPATADAVANFDGETESTTGPTPQVFSYALPTWGSLILRDNAGDNAGNFGITTGMSPYFAGGT